jgi:hypothetical protein
VTVVDLWVNALSARAAQAFAAQTTNEGIGELFGTDLSVGTPLDALLATMDTVGVDVGVLAGALCSLEIEGLLADADRHRGRFLVAAVADRPERPVEQVARLRDLAGHGRLALLRVTPLVHQYPLNHRLYYPLYAACSELGLPVSINVGVPGPRVRSACQHPELLEDLLIDFPGLVIIGAHMGHPFEALLMQYMLKWPSLYLSNSAYSAKYMDPGLVGFMGSSRGRGRVLFASDHPFFAMGRALRAARALPLDAESMAAYLGGTAGRLLTGA